MTGRDGRDWEPTHYRTHTLGEVRDQGAQMIGHEVTVAGYAETVRGRGAICFLMFPVAKRWEDVGWLRLFDMGLAVLFALCCGYLIWEGKALTNDRVGEFTTLDHWVAILATLLGGMAALALARSDSKWGKAVFGLMLAPMIVPRIVIAVGLFYLMAQIGLVASNIGLIIGHTLLAIPFKTCCEATSFFPWKSAWR